MRGFLFAHGGGLAILAAGLALAICRHPVLGGICIIVAILKLG